MTRIERAVERLRAGHFVLVYDADGREEEVDLFVAAEHATPEAVETLRREAGGLVFLAVAPQIGARFGLPFLHDVFAEAADRFPLLQQIHAGDLKYDSRSSFSLTINHRETFTGIPDDDRSLTIQKLAEAARDAEDLPLDQAMKLFGKRFRAPGHVHLCVGAEGLLNTRQGHTELGVALAEVAGVVPILAGAEMLGKGRALPIEEARKWAEAHDTVVVTGEEIQEAWAKFHGGKPHAVAEA